MKQDTKATVRLNAHEMKSLGPIMFKTQLWVCDFVVTVVGLLPSWTTLPFPQAFLFTLSSVLGGHHLSKAHLFHKALRETALPPLQWEGSSSRKVTVCWFEIVSRKVIHSHEDIPVTSEDACVERNWGLPWPPSTTLPACDSTSLEADLPAPVTSDDCGPVGISAKPHGMPWARRT